MNQKGFVNILVVIIAVLVLAAAGGYFAFKQGSLGGNTDKVNKPAIDLKASPSAIEKNGTFLLTWSTQNAVTCEASSPTAPDLPFKMNWSGPIELSGSRTYNEVPHDLLFELTCKNSAGDATFATASITIKSEGVSNETTNWNTYRSEEYGFEIKYPNALQTEEYHYSLEKVTAFPPVRFKDERGNLVEGTIRLGTLGDPRRDPAVDDGGNRIYF